MNSTERLRIPAEIALAALVAYVLGFWFTSLFPGYLPKIGGLWSAISAIVVTQSTRRETTSSASLRILGSAIGMVTGSLDPKLSPGLNALLRFVESFIGTGVAMLDVRLWPGPVDKD